jgi:hypothetical protein
MVMPAGSIAVNRASCWGFLASLVEIAFGAACVTVVAVALVAVGVALLVGLVVVEPDAVPGAGDEATPDVEAVVVLVVLTEVAAGFPTDLPRPAAPGPLVGVVVTVVPVVVAVVVVGAAGIGAGLPGAPCAAAPPLLAA